MTSHPWAAGTKVERCIDDLWFPAVITAPLSTDGEDATYDIKYLDDGKYETQVSSDELRLDPCQNATRPSEAATSPPGGRDRRLQLPLSGLIREDDKDRSDGAPEATPRAIIHGEASDRSESTIFVVNGSQRHLANGSGVRGIRFLRQSERV